MVVHTFGILPRPQSRPPVSRRWLPFDVRLRPSSFLQWLICFITSSPLTISFLLFFLVLSCYGTVEFTLLKSIPLPSVGVLTRYIQFFLLPTLVTTSLVSIVFHPWPLEVYRQRQLIITSSSLGGPNGSCDKGLFIGML